MHRFTGEISPRRARGVPVAEAGEGARGEVASRRARIAFMSEVKAGPAPAPPPFGKRRDAKGTGREWAGVGDDRGAAVNTRLLVMRREKPSPPLARDTCNFAPREGRGLVPPLPESSRGTPPPTPPGAGRGAGSSLPPSRDYKGTPSTRGNTRGFPSQVPAIYVPPPKEHSPALPFASLAIPSAGIGASISRGEVLGPESWKESRAAEAAHRIRSAIVSISFYPVFISLSLPLPQEQSRYPCCPLAHEYISSARNGYSP